jgi:hypothetical protein
VNKMKIKKLFLCLMLIIFLIGIISAQVSYCCERTNEGAWCQNAEEDECDVGFRTAPTSCEATSYCRLGTCINTQEGNCMSNTPQRVCDDEGGVWDDRDSNEIPQCQLGCCLIGEQAAFVTQTRCKKLSSVYGLEINYRTDINTEAECILSATSDVKGACVYETDFERNCKMTTREECSEMSSDGSADFHEGYLCSAESLNTICGARGGTTCVEGRDEVFFMDTCGNLANVYDYSKINNANYWTYVEGYGDVEVDCGSDGNAGSSTCGNCDYFLGSTCKKGNANYGDYICKDLGCTYEGDTYQHGETWCAESSGTSFIEVDENYEVTSSARENLDSGSKKDADVPGSRYFRLLCYDGEVMVEPCAEYRQEVCLQSEVNEFKTAACRVNRWQDCLAQDNKKDCENTDRRDCKWLDSRLDNNRCVPRNPPGFNFWEEGDAIEICAQASSVCTVTLKRSMEGPGNEDYDLKEGGDFSLNKLGTLKCEKNCYCLTDDMADKLGVDNYEMKDGKKITHDDWLSEQLEYCSALGDCGVSVNYIGEEGYLEQNDYQSDLLIKSK